VWDLIVELRAYGVEVFVHDPVADATEARSEYGLELVDWDALPQADAVVLAVAHETFLSRTTPALTARLKTGGCVIDVKAKLDGAALEAGGLHVWRL
jgi:UDP-N-acetyl-D-galactosamine dehydrogenase